MTVNISFVLPQQRPLALRLLFAKFPVNEQETRISDALRSADRGTLNLDGLIQAEENGQPVGVTLMMHQLDGVTLVWPPVVSCQAENVSEIENALMSRICEEIDKAGSKLAQALLAPDVLDELDLLKQHRFEHLADMFFLARTLTTEDLGVAANDGEFDHVLFSDHQTDRFASVIERTYQGSLDCPFLDGFRNGKDALVSHRLSGCFDPAGWRIYQKDSQDVGVLLMNEHLDTNAIELVYFGIVPEFRGKGLGRKILADGIQAAAIAGRSVVFLAVDCGNIYANSLYAELGFAELARRVVMIRRSSQPIC